MKDNHTPGPWRWWIVFSNPSKWWEVGEVNGDTDCPITGSISMNEKNGEDNARLIASAVNSYDKNCGPHAVECAESDLLGQCLEALEELVTEITNWEADVRSVIQIPIEHGMDLSKAKAILAKRKGEK